MCCKHWCGFEVNVSLGLVLVLLLATASDGSPRVSSSRGSTLMQLDSSNISSTTATGRLSLRQLVFQGHKQKWMRRAAGKSGVQNWREQQQHQYIPAWKAGGPRMPVQGNVAQQQQLMQQQQLLQHRNIAAAPMAAKASMRLGWMACCCLHKQLRDLYLPGTHDSGTSYPWTVPAQLPLVFDEVAAVIYNIVGDLSRTQHLTVYEQLQAGARVLDLRLAVNPWIPLQARTLHTHWRDLAAAASAATSSSTAFPQQQGMRAAGPSQQPGMQPLHAGELQRVFDLDVEGLEGNLNMAAVGGPLTAAELREAVVISHSLPGAQLAHVLADVRRFLAEQPTEVVVVMVKGDTVDVNVAGIKRMDDAAWAAAAQLFKEGLDGVQLLSQAQVEQQTLGQFAESAPHGSVLLYSWELQQQGLPSVASHQLQILESWGNGTNSEELPTLKARLLGWLQFWQARQWRQNSKPFMLMASAEVTLGVKTILQLIRNRIWLTRRRQQQQQRGAGGAPAGPMLQSYAELKRLGAVQSLFDLGVQTNQVLLAEVLQNHQVSKSFNVWSMDALSKDITSYIIGLNSEPQQAPELPMRKQQQ